MKGAENHPLFSRYVSPDKIITRIKEAIDKFPIKYDSRFDYKIEEGKNSIVFTITVKPEAQKELYPFFCSFLIICTTRRWLI